MISLKEFWDVISFRDYKAKKRRKNYDFLKAEIVKRHLSGHRGIIIDFKGKKFDITDVKSFRPPMYQVCKNQDHKYCIFWDEKKMSEEIGPYLVPNDPKLSLVTKEV